MVGLTATQDGRPAWPENRTAFSRVTFLNVLENLLSGKSPNFGTSSIAMAWPMKSSFTAVAVAALLILAGGYPPTSAQPPAAETADGSSRRPAEPKTDNRNLPASASSPAGEVKEDKHEHADGHDHAHDHEPAMEPGEVSPPEPPEGYQEEFDRRVAVFQSARDKLEAAILKQRETYIRYVNREHRTPAVKRAFREGQQQVRVLLDETYDAALDTIRMGMLHQEAATFLITMIEHRFNHDIYDLSTLEGAGRLADGGSQLLYVFQCGARSAVVSGKFDTARQMFEAIDDERMADVDQSLEMFLEEHRDNYEAEMAVREQEAQQDRLPRVLLRTTQGDVVLELFIDQAPSTVANFIKLVEQGFYDDLSFYQVIDNILALTGDAAGDGSGNSGQFLLDEHERPDARKALRGSLVMAKLPMGDTGNFIPNSASSQFAILFLPMISISEQQTVFGRVVEGMNVICRLRRVDPNKEKKGKIELPPDRIIEATVIRRPDQLPEIKYLDLTDLTRR